MKQIIHYVKQTLKCAPWLMRWVTRATVDPHKRVLKDALD